MRQPSRILWSRLRLSAKAAQVRVGSGKGETTVEMANGPAQRVSPFPGTIVLPEKPGAGSNHNCVSRYSAAPCDTIHNLPNAFSRARIMRKLPGYQKFPVII